MKKQKCTEIVKEKLEILLQIDEENIQVLNKLQKLSCTKFKIGDFIAVNEDCDEHIILDPLGQQKSGYSKGRKKYLISEDKKLAINTFLNKKFHFVIIENNSQVEFLKLSGAKKIKIGYYLILNDIYYHQIISKQEFEENYIIE